MIKSENLGQNAQNQRLFLIIAAPTKLVKYKIPVSKELPPHRACTKGEAAPYDTPPYEHAAGLFPRTKIPKTFCKSFTVWSFIHRLYGLRTKSAYNRGGHREYDQHKLRCRKRDKS